MNCLFEQNDFDPHAALEQVAAAVTTTGLGSDGFPQRLTGEVQVNGLPFTIPAGQAAAESAQLRWEWHCLERTGDTLLLARLYNLSDEPVVISHLAFSTETLPCLDTPDARMFIWHTWDMSVERLREGRFVSENLLHISSPGGNSAFLAGFLTLSRMKVSHQVDVGDSRRIYRAMMEFGEFTLPAGGAFNSEVLLAARYDDPYAALEDWAQKIHDLYQPRLPLKPAVGWCGGWLNVCGRELGGESTESYALGNAQAILERLNGFGVEFIWTSQSNLKDYIPGNWLKNNDYEFPDGLENFFRQLIEWGFKPGLWASPFWFFGEAEGMYEAHKNHLLCDREGNPFCFETKWCWSYEDDDSPWYHMHKYNLDGTHPDAIRYVKQIYAYYRSIGVRYYMLDFLSIIDKARLFDQTKTPQQAGCNILREIRETAGEETYLQTAVASSPGFTGIVNAARIGRDFGEGRAIEGGSLNDWRNASNVLHDLHYSNTLYLLKNVAGSYFTHRRTYINDYNLVTIDRPYPVEYARIVSTIFGMGGSNPIMLGDDLRVISDERLRYVKLILPRTQFSAVPADLFDRVQPEDYCRLMKLPIKTAWDEYLLVAAYNMDQTPYDLTLDFGKLGLSGDQVVYDFWNEEYRGVFRDSFPVHLPPESCKLLRLTRYREHPWLIGTDMHIQQGAAEIESLRWDEDTLTLTGRAVRPVGEKGNILLLMPRNFKVKRPGFGTHIVKELLDYRVLVSVPLSFGQGAVDFRLEFEHWDFHNLSPRGHIPYSNMEELRDYMEKNYVRESTRVFE